MVFFFVLMCKAIITFFHYLLQEFLRDHYPSENSSVKTYQHYFLSYLQKFYKKLFETFLLWYHQESINGLLKKNRQEYLQILLKGVHQKSPQRFSQKLLQKFLISRSSPKLSHKILIGIASVRCQRITSGIQPRIIPGIPLDISREILVKIYLEIRAGFFPEISEGILASIPL